MSYTWITPKTDWTTTTRFEYTDYNRIRNNLLYINEKLNELYPDKAQTLDLGDAKTGYANEYAVSEFNAFEEALESFTRIGQDVNIGDRNYYRGNDSFIWADALNRLEQCCVRWKEVAIIPIESIVISTNDDVSDVTIGETITFNVSISPSNATYADSKYWRISHYSYDFAIINKNQFTMTPNEETFQYTYGTKNDHSINYYYVRNRTNSRSSEIILRIIEPNGRMVESNKIMMTCYPTGTYFKSLEDNMQYPYYYVFKVIGHNIDSTNITTLYTMTTGDDTGFVGNWGGYSDRNSNFRSNINTAINQNFSSSLKNAMQSISKVVISSRNSRENLSAKFHLVSSNEMGSQQLMPDEFVLGNKNYPIFTTNAFDGCFPYPYSDIRWSLARNLGFGSDGDDATIAYGSSDDHGYHADVMTTFEYQVSPLIFLNNNNIKVIKHQDTTSGHDWYIIDWSNSADSIALKNVPLGSFVCDLYGTR